MAWPCKYTVAVHCCYSGEGQYGFLNIGKARQDANETGYTAETI